MMMMTSVREMLMRCCLLLTGLLQKTADVIYLSTSSPLNYIINWKQKALRDEERKDEEVRERDIGDEVARKFANGKFQDCVNLNDIGSRLQKLWYKVVARKGEEKGEGQVDGNDKEESKVDEKILTVAPISANCPLKLDHKGLKALNTLLHTIQHPLLHPIDEVYYDPQSGHVVIVQPLMIRGSLKDLIYGGSHDKDWSVKYRKYSQSPLTLDKVACYGGQILEAIIYLYDRGFPPLGHIQTGNIFVEGDVCQVGGYENRLLGYRTRLYNLCETFNCTKDIDIVMFGHVIFEMTCGYELTHLVPNEGEYRSVKDKVLKDVLQVIFHQDEEGRFTSSIKEILSLAFFQEVNLPLLGEVCLDTTSLTRDVRLDTTSLTRDMRHLLSKVTKGKRKKQVTPKPKNRTCPVQ